MKCKTITKWQDGTIIQNSYYRELINGDKSIFFVCIGEGEVVTV